MESYKGIAIPQREATIVSCKVSISSIILHHVRITLSHASFCLHPLYFCIKFHQLLRIIWPALRQSQHIITVFCFHPVESCAESKQRICIRLSNPLKLIHINVINVSFTTFADFALRTFFQHFFGGISPFSHGCDKIRANMHFE